MISLKKDKNGFTIIELMIASSVFGVIMLIAMTGIMSIGRTYYKGVTTSRTQETSRYITNEVTNAFQFNGESLTDVKTGPKINDLDVKAQCIGKYRYNYVTNSIVGDQNNAAEGISRHALWLDVIKPGEDCARLDLTQAVPEDENTDTSPEALSIRREVLPQRTRLDRFTMIQPDGRSYMVLDVSVIYGNRDLSPAGVCVPNRDGGQFCAASQLTTTVKKRL